MRWRWPWSSRDDEPDNDVDGETFNAALDRLTAYNLDQDKEPDVESKGKYE